MKTLLGIVAFALAAQVAAAQTLYAPSGAVGTSSTGNVGIGRSDPVARLDVQGTSADANAWALWLRNSNGNVIVGARNDGYFALGNGLTDQVVKDASGKVGIGTTAPTYLLHVSGNVGVNGDQKFFARYNGSEDYKGSFGWSHLQLGNSGPNWIVAGRTQVGGSLTFIVNNTTDYAYGSFDGIAALHLNANGDVGVGITSPESGVHLKARFSGLPATSGTAQVHAVLRLQPIDTNLALDLGTKSATGAWLQSTNRSDLSQYFPLLLNPNGGNVGIGTTSPTHKLAVNGTIRAKEVIVDTGWADHVFAADYRLAPLSEVEQHIRQNGHLPDVPSAADVAVRGVSVGEMQKVLLQKVEEMTLYVIAQHKLVTAQQARIDALSAHNRQMQHQLDRLSADQ